MGEFSPPRLSIVAPTDVPDQNQIHLTAERKLIVERRSEITAAGNNRSLDGKPDIVEGFLRLAALPTFPLDRLSRYEHLLGPQARQIVITLESLRRRKRKLHRSHFTSYFRCPKRRFYQ